VRRYAGDTAQQVVVIGGMSAPRPRLRRRGVPEPAGVAVTRATVIDAGPLDGEAAAAAWLAAAGRVHEERVAAALAVLNRALHARRIATADPYGGEIAQRHALATRIGYGTGEQVAEGRWAQAQELAPARHKRARESALRPQERFAALLAARDVALACELLALRARLDREHGRDREAALQLEAALGAAVAELAGWLELDGMRERVAELSGLVPGVAAAAAAARSGTLDETGREAVGHALARLEAALRARTAAAAF
jgi:hypothetical protein